MQPSTIVTICSAVVALASALSAPALDGLWPGHGAYLMSITSLLAIVAGIIVNALTKQTQGAIVKAPLAKDLPIVDPTTGEQVGTNISSSSSLLPGNASAKGV